MGSDLRLQKTNLFLDLSEEFGKDWKIIGLRLGLTQPMLDNIEADNPCQRERGHQILVKWEQTTGKVDAVQRLDEALRKAPRVELADKYIPLFKSIYDEVQSRNRTVLCTSQGTTARGDDVSMLAQQMIKELKSIYKKRSKVPMIPWAGKGGKIATVPIQKVYTNLVLLVDIDGPNLPIRFPLQGLEQLFIDIETAIGGGAPETNGAHCQMGKMEDDDGEDDMINRVVARGRTGSGKTTFLMKLSHDWAYGKEGPLKGAKAVFLLPLKKLDHKSNLGEVIVEHFFPKKVFTPKFVEEFIQKNQKDVAVLLDGYDEFKGKGPLQGDSGNIVKMMRNEYLPDVRLLVTTRPGRVGDFMGLSDDITDEYRHLEITGFSSSDIDKYVEEKIFPDSPDLAKRLLNYLEENNLKTELASLPLMCCAFCQLTKFTDGKDFKDMNTISTLFDKLIDCLLKYHPRSKEQRLPETKSPTLETSTAPSEVLPESSNLDQESSGPPRVYASDDLIRALGKVALMGFTRSQEEELIFCNRDFLDCNLDPQQIISRACKAGILLRDGEVEYRPTRYEDLDINQNEGEDFDVHNITFVLKIFQEKFAGMHLAYLSNGTPEERDQFLVHVHDLTSLQRAMDLGNVLMFACGASISAARAIIGRVVEHLVVETERVVEFMKGTLHYSKCQEIQRQIEFCLQLNYESQCKGSLNDVLKPIMCRCTQLRLVGISSYVMKSLGYFLEYSQCGKGVPVKSLELVRLYLNSSSEFREFLDTFPGLEEKVTNSMTTKRRKKKRAHEIPLTEDQRIEKLRKGVEARKQIPKYLLQRTNDTFLAVLPLWEEVSKMQMSDCNFGPVIEGLRHCSIETLTLNGVKAENEKDWERLFRMLADPGSASLHKLTLSMTDIEEDCLAKLVPALNTQTGLRYLKLSGNEIGEPFLDALGKYPPMENLETLILDKTDMDSESIEQLGDLLVKFPGLTTLDIRRNEGSDDTAIISILVNLHHCKNLRCLKMSFHEVTDKGFERLRENVGFLSQLTEFHLVHSSRPNDVIKCATSILPSMHQLQNLMISATPPDKTKQHTSASQVDRDVAFRFSNELTRTPTLVFLSILYVRFEAESFIHLLQRCTEAKEAAALATLRFSSSCIPADVEVRKPVRDAKESELLRIWV